MSAGWSRIRIFNPMGVEIAEIEAITKRSWVLNGVGRCQFTVGIYNNRGSGFNPACTLSNFNYGNLVLIEHKPSQNADGTINGLLPPWVGVILPPRNWDLGKLTVTAFSAEQILKYRPMPIWTIDGTNGWLFTQLLFFSGYNGGILIQPGNISDGGATSSRHIKLSALDEITALVKASGYDFDVTPQVSSQNVLSLYGNWYIQKGAATGQLIHNGNTKASSPLFTEQGQFYNTIFAYSDANTPLSRGPAVIVSDQNSVNQHGMFGINVVFSGTAGVSTDVIQNLANAYLAANSQPTQTFAPVVLDVGNAFSYLNTGNTWLIYVDTVGFLANGAVGLQGSIRITAMEYSEADNFVTQVGQMI